MPQFGILICYLYWVFLLIDGKRIRISLRPMTQQMIDGDDFKLFLKTSGAVVQGKLTNGVMEYEMEPYYYETANKFAKKRNIQVKIEQRIIDNRPFDKKIFESFPIYLDDIQAYIEKIDSDYNFVKKIILGETSKQTKIISVNLFGENYLFDNHLNYWIDCGSSGNGWMNVAVCVSFIQRLIKEHETYLKDNTKYSLLNYINFYILPIMNPDGYFKSTENDLSHKSNLRNVDLNSNFPMKWKRTNGSSIGGPGLPNDSSGNSENSELETRAVTEFFKENTKEFVVSISLSDFGKSITMPNAFSQDRLVDNDYLMNIIKKMRDSLFNDHQADYQYGPLSNIVGVNSGTLMDYNKHINSINVSLCIALPRLSLVPGDTSKHLDNLVNNANHTYTMIKVLSRFLLNEEIEPEDTYPKLYSLILFGCAIILLKVFIVYTIIKLWRKYIKKSNIDENWDVATNTSFGSESTLKGSSVKSENGLGVSIESEKDKETMQRKTQEFLSKFTDSDKRERVENPIIPRTYNRTKESVQTELKTILSERSKGKTQGARKKSKPSTSKIFSLVASVPAFQDFDQEI